MPEDQRPACRSLAIGHTIYDSSSKPVFLDPKMLDGDTMGESTDNVWVGHCATKEQALKGWEMLGSPGSREDCIPALMSLKAHQFFLAERATGRTQIVEVDAGYLAALAGRGGLGE